MFIYEYANEPRLQSLAPAPNTWSIRSNYKWIY